MPLRIAFAGTPAFATTTLQALVNSPHEVVAVYCQPDRPKGRGRALTMCPCKSLALQHNIPIEQPKNFKEDHTIEQLKSYQIDIMIVVAYGIILPQVILDTPKLGCVNVHASLLPRWRGAAPIQKAIQAGDEETGVTIMQMDEGLDTGPILSTARSIILAQDTHATLAQQLSELGAETLLNTLSDIELGRANPQDQDQTQACYANKIHKSEALIDWHLPAKQIDQNIRALAPWPVAETHCPKGTLRIHMSEYIQHDHDAKPGTVMQISQDGIDIAAPGGYVRLLELQLPNQRILEAHAFANGQKDWLVARQCILGKAT